MPLIEVTMVEGRDAEKIRNLISALTQSTVDTIGAKKESIRVVIREVPPTHWAAGDETIAERRAKA